jgi:hypothetical protein
MLPFNNRRATRQEARKTPPTMKSINRFNLVLSVMGRGVYTASVDLKGLSKKSQTFSIDKILSFRTIRIDWRYESILLLIGYNLSLDLLPRMLALTSSRF